MIAETEPKLAPPGAGLPQPELFIARLLFKWRFWTGSRESFNSGFQAEREKIRRLIASCDAETGARQVLIQRVRGLEDSSRYWSVWMTLEHLRIVHEGITRTIGALAKGVKLEGQASTARVKPGPQITIAVIPEFERSCDHLLKTVADIPNLNTVARFAHPWFGLLNAAGWHALSLNHLAIHRKQIERIIEGLRTH